MTDERDTHSDTALDARLDAARTALAALRAPADLELVLRRAHRDRAARRAAVDEAPATGPASRTMRPVWVGGGAALAAGLLVAALILPGLRAPEPAGPAPAAGPITYAPRPDGPPGQPRPFQPVAYYGGTPMSQSYLILRARVPVAALAIDTGDYVDGTIEADLLIGDDGLIAGIRFDDASSSQHIR